MQVTSVIWDTLEYLEFVWCKTMRLMPKHKMSITWNEVNELLEEKNSFFSLPFTPPFPSLDRCFFSIYSHLQLKLCLLRFSIPMGSTSTKPWLWTPAYYSKQIPIADSLLTKLRIFIRDCCTKDLEKGLYAQCLFVGSVGNGWHWLQSYLRG